MTSGTQLLSDWIERQKVSQRKAADLIGMDETHLAHILSGNRRPGLDNAVKIERATGIVVEAWVPIDDGKNGNDDSPTPAKRKFGKA